MSFANQFQRGLYLGMNAKPRNGVRAASLVQEFPLGAFFDDEDGGRFRYSKAAAVALLAGHLVETPALGGADTTLQSAAAVAAVAAIGDTRVYLNGVSTAQAAKLYEEGIAGICDVDLVAVHTHRIKTNNAIATTGGTGYIDLYDPLIVALTTSDKVALQVNPYKNLVVAPTTPVGKIIGGTLCPVPASYYFWAQVRGWWAGKLKDVTTNLGAGPVMRAGTTAGTLATAAEADSAAAYKQVIGQSSALWLDEYAAVIWLCCE